MIYSKTQFIFFVILVQKIYEKKSRCKKQRMNFRFFVEIYFIDID